MHVLQSVTKKDEDVARETEDVRYELPTICPLDSGHRTADKRLTPLTDELKRAPLDFMLLRARIGSSPIASGRCSRNAARHVRRVAQTLSCIRANFNSPSCRDKKTIEARLLRRRTHAPAR